MMILKNKKITVMGLGLFSGGVEVTRFLVKRGARVTVTDLRTKKILGPSVKALSGLPVTLRLGRHVMKDFTGADIIIKSPAVPDGSPYLVAALECGVHVDTEMNMVFRMARVPVVGITGSNGKTTTTALLGHLFNSAGRTAVVGGNIGTSVVNRVSRLHRDTTLVLELSSFQLDDLGPTGAAPQVAIVTNLTPNHLDRHGTMRAYAAAKKNIVLNQGVRDTVVLNYDDARLRKWEPQCPGRVFYFSRKRPVPQGCYIKDSTILFRTAAGTERTIARTELLQLPGVHNLENALAAVTAACIRRVPVTGIRRGLRTFSGVPHRLELVRTEKGIRFFNDSIATTPESTVAALRSFDGNVVLIAGGYDKKIPFSKLAGAAARRTRGIVLVGATAGKINRAIAAVPAKKGPVVKKAETLEAAVAAATDMARPGDVVLLSPACASYDMFTNFAERGDRFREAVRSL